MSLDLQAPSLESLVEERIESWRAGTAPDAAAFLDEYPQLRHAKSLVLELILEEYCLRREAGDDIRKTAFCEQFPSVRQSVFRMLEVHELLDQRPDFAAELAQAEWPLPGEAFMGFEILELLGCGALARVYLARESALGNRPVVVKVSRHGMGEAATLGKLSHPNIVPIHSVQHDQSTGWTVICMPLVGTATAVDLLDEAFAGGSRPAEASVISRVIHSAGPSGAARQLMPREPVRPRRGSYQEAVARIGWQLAEALETAHQRGVLHRDLKPSNILLGWSSRPMLLDFNLSSDAEIAGGRIGGTPAYMAPEAIASLMLGPDSAAGQVDPRSDIYSLGAVLFELLAGHLPARPENADRLPPDAYDAWLKCKQSPPPELRAFAPEIDPQLEAIVRKCLAVDPQGRYATAAALAQDLRAYLGLVPSLGRRIKRYRGAILAASLLAIALIGGGSYYVATRPPYYQQLYKHGLAQNEQGEYDRAAETFASSLKARPDFAEPRFALGQTYRRLEKWDEARAEFTALDNFGGGWAYALAAECAVDLGQDTAALADMRRAHQAGLRNADFLLHYAQMLRKKFMSPEAIDVYREVLEVDRSNSTALCNRALTYLDLSLRNPPLHTQALVDARQNVQLNPKSFEAAYAAAKVFAGAALKDNSQRDEGIVYLKAAIDLGLPRDLIDNYRNLLKPLLTSEIDALLKTAPPRPADYSYRPFVRKPPTLAAEWKAFLEQSGSTSGK